MDEKQYAEFKEMLSKIIGFLDKPKDEEKPCEEACGDKKKEIEEENKSLKSKIADLEKELASVKAEKEAVEKDAGELVEALEKLGVEL